MQKKESLAFRPTRRRFHNLLCKTAVLVPVAVWAGRARAEGYEGVAPGLPGKSPLPPPDEDGVPRLVWTGFQKAEGGGQVFLKTNKPVNYDVTDAAKGKKVIVYLRNCRIHLENNQRKLDTRFFGTAVASVRARQKRNDVEVSITLKKPVSPDTSIQEGDGGSQFVLLTFTDA